MTSIVWLAGLRFWQCLRLTSWCRTRLQVTVAQIVKTIPISWVTSTLVRVISVCNSLRTADTCAYRTHSFPVYVGMCLKLKTIAFLTWEIQMCWLTRICRYFLNHRPTSCLLITSLSEICVLSPIFYVFTHKIPSNCAPPPPRMKAKYLHTLFNSN